MAFGCCHVVAAGSVFLESCSMSLLKTSAWGKASRSRGVSWGSHLAFLIGFSELCSDEMKSQIEKGGKMAPKGSEEKKIEQIGFLLCFEDKHVLFEPLKLTTWGEDRGVNSRLVIPLPRAGQACIMGSLTQNIIYLIILPLPTGMVSLAGEPWGWDAVNVSEARICHSCWADSLMWPRQEWLQHVPRTSCHPCPTLGKGGTAVSDTRDSLAGLESSPDGCYDMFVSLRSFRAIRVIKHNWKSHI